MGSMQESAMKQIFLPPGERRPHSPVKGYARAWDLVGLNPGPATRWLLTWGKLPVTLGLFPARDPPEALRSPKR